MAKKRKNPAAERAIATIKQYQHVFGTPEGAAVLYDMMDKHGILSPHPAKDPVQMALKEGERLVILRILTLLKTNPRQLLERIEQHETEME